MPKFRLNISVAHKGAIFNAAETKAAGARMVTEINELLAEEAKARILARFAQVLQNPTGYLESQVAVQRNTVARNVWDSNVIYGGWIEGVSSRNKATRFKGYHTFRLVQQSMQQDKEKIAGPAVRQFVSEMNR